MVDELAGAIAEAEGGRSVLAPWGKRYAVADKVAAMPLLKFAHLQKVGLNESDPELYDVVRELLWAVLTDDSWARFEVEATEARADIQELLGMIQPAIEAITARPISRPSVSPGGQPPITENLTDISSYEDRKRQLQLVPVTLEALAG